MKYKKLVSAVALSATVAAVAGLSSTESVKAVHTSEVPKYADNAVHEGEQVRLTDGQLIASPNSGVFLLDEGKRFPIESPQVFRSYGYHFSDLKMIPDSTLQKIPYGEVLPFQSGTLVSAEGDPTVYVIENGKKRRIHSPQVLRDAGYSFDQVMEVSQAAVDRHPTGEEYNDPNYIPNGSTVYAEGTGAFLIDEDTRRPIPDPETFRSKFGSFDMLRKVSNSALDKIPYGPSVVPGDGTLVKDDNTVYLVEDGMKRPFSSPQQLIKGGFSFSEIRNVPESVVEDLPNGPGMDQKSVSQEETIAHVVVSSDNTSTLEKAVKQADLVETFNGDTEYTVFAPTDSAFGNLNQTELNELLQDDRKEDLQGLLKDHAVKGEVTAAELVKKDSVETLNGKTLDVEVNGSTVKVGGVEVDMTDVQASNGVVHTVKGVINAKDFTQNVVDRAVNNDNLSTLEKAVKQADLVSTLSDESAEYTVFAPTDSAFDKLDDSTLNDLLKDENKSELQSLLKDHVVKGEVTASTLVNKDSLENLNGNTLNVEVNGSTVKVGDVKVDMTDIQSSNGVVHTVKSVIQL